MGKLTENDIGRLCSMYNAGRTHREIADTLGVHRITVTDKIKALVEMGVLPKRDDHCRVRDTTAVKMALVEQGYKDGKSLAQIASDVNISIRTVSKYLVVMKKDGRLPQERKVKTITTQKREGRRYNGSMRIFAPGQPTLKEGETVNCTLAVSKTCIYGIEGGSGWNGKCRYILCEGHSRGCSYKACNKYSKVGAGNPRRTYQTEDML